MDLKKIRNTLYIYIYIYREREREMVDLVNPTRCEKKKNWKSR